MGAGISGNLQPPSTEAGPMASDGLSQCTLYSEEDQLYPYLKGSAASAKAKERKKTQKGAPVAAPLSGILRVILCGLYDKNAKMSLLRGSKPILTRIWRYLLDLWTPHIGYDFKLGDTRLPYAIAGTVRFPAPADIVVNMMPFIYDDINSLPKRCRAYWGMIEACTHPCHRGKVGYLTIHESWVKIGDSQRRPGIHTESPGVIEMKNMKTLRPRAGKGKVDITGHVGHEINITSWSEAWRWYEADDILDVAWGGGTSNYPDGDIPPHMLDELKTKTPKTPFPDRKGQSRFEGGIFMASNVTDSCEVYAAKICRLAGVVGPHGDLEHVSRLLEGYGTKLKANQLIWMSDRTPHASLPIHEVTDKGVRKKRGYVYRQYFRIVGPNVTVWYEDHSTANPNVRPGTKFTIKGNKFNAKGQTVTKNI